MKATKNKIMYGMSLGGTVLFAFLSIAILFARFAPFQSRQSWFQIRGTMLRGIDFIGGSYNVLNGIKVNCNAFVIATIILSILVIVAAVLRGINRVPKYSRFISSVTISTLSVLLMICVMVFFVKLDSFNNHEMAIAISVGYGIGAFLYLIFGIATALFSISLFITDKGIAK